MNDSAWVFGLACLAVVFSLAAPVRADEEQDNGLVEMTVELLGNSDKELRALALEQVRTEAEGTAATKKFAALLPSLSPEGQIALLSALADRGDGAARPAVLEIVRKGGEGPVRVAAIGALGYLGEPADWRLLVRLLGAKSKAEQTAAHGSLVRLHGDKVAAEMAGQLSQFSPQQQVALLKIFATRRALDTIPQILSAAVSDDARVRRQAMTTLGQIAAPEHVGGMVQGVLKAERGAERAAAEKAVMFVCAQVDDPEKRADPLLAVMNNLKPADKAIVLSLLGRVGGSAALEMIEAEIAKPNRKAHEVGLKALCNWPNASVAPQLARLASTDGHKNHRIWALRALIRIAPLRDERTDTERLDVLKQAMTMATRDQERLFVIKRAQAIRTPESLRFVVLYLEKPKYAQQACESVVELAHDRKLRDDNKAEFHQALDQVIETSNDATVIDRAHRYKKGQTWVRPKR